jgi:hypothetical protein
MLADPVPALFVGLAVLSKVACTEKPLVTLVDPTPTLAVTRLLVPGPPPTLHRSDESDSQLDLSQLVPPCCRAKLCAPIFAPLIVMLVDPVAALLTCPVTLNDAKSFE